MAATETVRRIKQCRADSNYGKRKHANAASRKSIYESSLNIPCIIATAIVGSAFFATLSSDFPDWCKWTGGILGVLTAVFTAVKNKLGFSEVVGGHRSMASRYRNCSKRCSNSLALYNDNIIDDAGLAEKLEALSNEYSIISDDAELYPTNASDYSKAKKGIQEGEEQYTTQELELEE